jgi:hypothetical protein
VGLRVGRSVGLTVGRIVGLTVGRIVGLSVGRSVGLTVGRIVGLTVGRIVGLSVGAMGEGGSARADLAPVDIINGTDRTTGVTHATFNASRRVMSLPSVGFFDAAATLPPSAEDS